MSNEAWNFSVNSTRDNVTPDPYLTDFKLPKLGVYSNDAAEHKTTSASPQDFVSITNNSLHCKIPQIDYGNYREYHFSKRLGSNTRYDSESPKCNYFYQPHTIRVSPRSYVKVFTYFPIANATKSPNKVLVKKVKKKNIPKYNNSPRVLSLVSNRVKPPEREIKPAMTYGDKLCRLYDLAALNIK